MTGLSPDDRVHAVHGQERRTLCGIGPWTVEEAPRVRIRFVVLGTGRDDRVTCSTCRSAAALGEKHEAAPTNQEEKR